MEKQTQKDYLNSAKGRYSGLVGQSVTWDRFAELCGIAPRALKTYRMPETSGDYRPMPPLAKQSVDRLLKDAEKGARKRNQ